MPSARAQENVRLLARIRTLHADQDRVAGKSTDLRRSALRGEADEDKLDEAQVEHDGAKTLIAELLAGSPDDDYFDAKVKVLSEEIKHHVKEEEQRDGIFAQAKASDVDLEGMLEQLQARKKELQKQIETSGVPTPETRSMRGAEVKIGQPITPQS